VERDGTLSLSVDEKVNHSRPSIDVLFESAAMTWSSAVIGAILTGASPDGARGIRLIRDRGGMTIAQDPASAEHPVMPRAAIESGGVEQVLSLDGIGQLLASYAGKGRGRSRGDG